MRGYIDIAPEMLGAVVRMIPAKVVGSANAEHYVRFVIEAETLPAEHCIAIVERKDGQSVTVTLQAA